MRSFPQLDQINADAATGVITFTAQGDSDQSLALRREGDYVPLSASYGALEIALRPRARELIRTLKRLQPNDGLKTTYHVGTGEAFLGLGRRTDGALVLRPTVVGDASGYFCLNLTLAPAAASALIAWLGDEEPTK